MANMTKIIKFKDIRINEFFKQADRADIYHKISNDQCYITQCNCRTIDEYNTQHINHIINENVDCVIMERKVIFIEKESTTCQK